MTNKRHTGIIDDLKHHWAIMPKYIKVIVIMGLLVVIAIGLTLLVG